jgi:polygalacturonase
MSRFYFFMAAVALLAISAGAADLPWPAANDILARVKPPTFPDKNFSVRGYGAVGDGKTDDTDAIAKAIKACFDAGGGHVVLSKGQYLTGAIQLLSNVDLHLDGATLRFSGDASEYPLMITRYQGIDLMNYSPLIHAVDQQNIAITGDGVIDGSLTSKWNRDGKGNFALLEKMAADGVAIADRKFGPEHPLRTTFVEPYNCTNVLIQGVTIQNSRFWQQHPVLCTNVIVDGVTTQSTTSQTDGCDPESCDGVVIENCTLGAGDDCIAIKSGRNPDSQRVHRPSKNIVVVNSKFHGPWGLITCGSEQTEGIEHVFAYNLSTINTIQDVRGDTGVRDLLYMKTNTARGGFIRDIHLDTITGKFNRAVVYGIMNYGKKTGDQTPQVTDITISNLKGESAQSVLDLTGLDDNPMTNITLSNCVFENVAKPNSVKNAKVTYDNVTINGKPAK